MFAAATSFFSRSNISQNYTIASPLTANSRTATPTPGAAVHVSSSSSALPTPAHVPQFQVGLWRVQSATHKVTSKRVSVWSFDKRCAEVDRLSPMARDKTMDVLKAEATSLSKLRHPCILEMVEPLEETRSELIFATEPLLSSLYLAIPGSPYASSLVDLDEVEGSGAIQKGMLQLCNGLSFLHTSARTIHSNINPESILINNAGDWKLGGLGLTIPLKRPDGSSAEWEFPSYDNKMPPYVQRSFDYIAPEYVLDEVLNTASDMYSLGCLIHAVHLKGDPPFKNFGNLGSVREHAGRPLSGIVRLERDLQGIPVVAMLASLIARHPQNRPTPSSLPSHPFFSSLPISTLNFLDRSNFAAKSREEKIAFMKGLTGVLDRFSEGLRIRKILPSLLEEMKDPHLLPYILPNMFSISIIVTPQQFASLVLPSLKPLFAIKEPPQNMLTLLENLNTLQEKTEKAVFREHVLPLVYNALESEHAAVQERALGVVPGLCESIDYAEVQGVLFPRVALVFTKTRILSVKVATLVTFLSMVKHLTSLTQKLVPLLSKIRTKEPAVTMATLSVQEAMGLKVDREAVATLVLPQLWAMSIGPLLNVEQFQRFMAVIRKLGDRVEREHNQFLRDSQRIEDRSATVVNGTTDKSTFRGGINFETLVGGAGPTTIKADTELDGNWEDDVWGSILSSYPEQDANFTPPQSASQSPPISQTAIVSPVPAVSHSTQSLPSSPRIGVSLGVAPSRPLSSRTSTGSSGLRVASIPAPPLTPTFASTSSTVARQSAQSRFPGSPLLSSQNSPQPRKSTPPKPNYNVSLSDIIVNPNEQPPLTASLTTTLNQSHPPISGVVFTPAAFSTPAFASHQAIGNILTPLKPQQPSISGVSTNNPLSKDIWSDFDPLA
ncbi:kinase-like domain-containing protein [Multifurca ochricompacta]|uniref:Kinase-like domain-containing protein n=1 Tax=Multifurca ochricompacta TaxID=376703 RepID=A0AAD4MCP4_9AGAM|nr:kinase-like domain-containing protein [Multifurca ochricompacta]